MSDDDLAAEGAPEAADARVEGEQPSEIEQLAAEMGWRPKEGGKTAREWVLDTQQIASRSNRDLKAVREQVERMARATETMIERERREERERIQREMDDAIDAGDKDKVRKLSGDLAKAESAPQPSNDEVQRFVDDNAWMRDDEEARDYAVSVSNRLAAQGKSIPEQLRGAKEAVLKRFPEYAPEKVKEPLKLAGQDTRETGSTARGPKGYAQMPAEARRAADDFERRGKGKAADYAKAYWSERETA